VHLRKKQEEAEIKLQLLDDHQSKLEMEDRRNSGDPIAASYFGELTDANIYDS